MLIFTSIGLVWMTVFCIFLIAAKTRNRCQLKVTCNDLTFLHHNFDDLEQMASEHSKTGVVSWVVSPPGPDGQPNVIKVEVITV